MLWTGGLTFRQVRVLIKGLPPDSSTVLKSSGPAASWSTTEYMLAHLIDELRESNWMFYSANFVDPEKDKPPKRPEPFKRPYVEQPDAGPGRDKSSSQKFATVAELSSFIQGINAAT